MWPNPTTPKDFESFTILSRIWRLLYSRWSPSTLRYCQFPPMLETLFDHPLLYRSSPFEYWAHERKLKNNWGFWFDDTHQAFIEGFFGELKLFSLRNNGLIPNACMSRFSWWPQDRVISLNNPRLSMLYHMKSGILPTMDMNAHFTTKYTKYG